MPQQRHPSRHYRPIGHGRMLVLVVLLAAAIALMFWSRSCARRSSEGPLPPVAGDTLRVAIEYSPAGVMSSGDTLAGFAYDMLRIVADSAGLTLKFTPITSLPQALKGLEQGRYDLVAADVPVTAEMRSRYRYTEPAYLDRLVLVQSKTPGKTAVTNQLDLAGRHVWVPAASPALDRLHALGREIGDTIYVHADSAYSAEQLYMLTAAGEIPLAVIGESVANAMARADSGRIDVATSVSFTQFKAWLQRHEASARADALDSAIVHFRTTPAYRELVARYGLTPAP